MGDKIVVVASGTPPYWKEYLRYLLDKKAHNKKILEKRRIDDQLEYKNLPWFYRLFIPSPARDVWGYTDWEEYEPTIIGYYNWDVRREK